ncbi:MAG: hypothetical protein LBU65_10995 [Planctomycetaceae bacterium]|jgi:hypothetical protein|nr:hypothetical protein [Planctomycetaceae bacterium]
MERTEDENATQFFENVESQEDLLLMSYLDRELEPVVREQLESRLAHDTGLREKLAAMERSWKSLELLQRDECDKKLVETTLETVALSAEADILSHSQQQRRDRRGKYMVVGLLMLFVVLLGFHVTRQITPDPNFSLICEMPIIERFNRYRTIIDDTELLFELTNQKVFYDPQQIEQTTEQTNIQTFTIHPSMSEVRRRYDRIKAMKPDSYDYLKLYNNRQTFYRLPPDVQDRYRELNHKIEHAASPFTIDYTLTVYYDWLRNLSTFEKARLQDHSIPVETRIAEIKRKLQTVPVPRITTTPSELAGDSIDSVKNQRLAEFLEQNYTEDDLDNQLNQPPDIGYRLLEDAFNRYHSSNSSVNSVNNIDSPASPTTTND